MRLRKFGRHFKHRKAMLRNLATNLAMHERITTTIQKAKEMRPLIEKCVHKAKANDYQGNAFLNKTFFTKEAIIKFKEIAKRYENQPAGFTRIEYLGKRANDKADMCYIELIGNPIEAYNNTQMNEQKQKLGLQTYWEWEHKILKQEIQYYEQLINDTKAQIEQEIDQRLSQQQVDNVETSKQLELSNQLRKDVEKKYQQKMKFIEASYARAKNEEQIHMKQQDYKRYDKMFKEFAFNSLLDVKGLKQI